MSGKARGRHLRQPLHPVLVGYTSSAALDAPLALHDITGSEAHVRGLLAAELLSPAAAARLLEALATVRAEMVAGSFLARPEDEDVHMAVERRVSELEPEFGPRLHTGRSRNDQVALDLRLWSRGEAARLVGLIADLVEVLATLARAEASTVMPGYTHLQRAQPVSLGHHLLAHVEMLERDAERLRDAHRRAARSPLGAGALAGSTLPLDPGLTAELLGLEPLRNSLDAVADRDFLLDLSYACLTLGLHLSRLGEEVVLWNSSEFGFVRLADSVATGSSLMPQKRNPDVAELLRGRAGEPLGALVALATVLKGLPLAYNRDLQERGMVFRSAEVVAGSLGAACVLFQNLEFDRAAMASACADPGLLATDRVDELVRSGVPFREAHGRVAEEFAKRAGSGAGGGASGAGALAALRARDLPGSPHPRRVGAEARAALRRARSLRRWALEGA